MKPGNAGGEGRGLGSRGAQEGGREMWTGASLTAPERVRRLQAAPHAKAKEAPSHRFHTLKVWRDDVLLVAWGEVRRNGGAPGVDGETVADIEARSVEAVAWGTGAGAEGRDLPAASGSAGVDCEEATWEVSGTGHSLPAGPGGADGGVAGVVADGRGGLGPGAIRLSVGKKRTRCGPTGASAGEHGPLRGRGRGFVGLLRPDTAR